MVSEIKDTQADETIDRREPQRHGSGAETPRLAAAIALIVVGIILTVGTYFWLAAPWGLPPTSIRYSDPRLAFAPTLVIIGVIMVFLAAVVYELWPERPP